MSFKEYLHEKAEESRHNETIAYIMFLAGAVFFVGGVLESLNLTESPSWFMFIPYHAEPIAGAVLGLTLTISGFCLIIFGIVAGLICSRDRGWYMHELRNANSLEDTKMHEKARKITLKRRKTKSNLPSG
jgi:hypothetical protein